MDTIAQWQCISTWQIHEHIVIACNLIMAFCRRVRRHICHTYVQYVQQHGTQFYSMHACSLLRAAESLLARQQLQFRLVVWQACQPTNVNANKCNKKDNILAHLVKFCCAAPTQICLTKTSTRIALKRMNRCSPHCIVCVSSTVYKNATCNCLQKNNHFTVLVCNNSVLIYCLKNRHICIFLVNTITFKKDKIY